jgi:hypothetical protein
MYSRGFANRKLKQKKKLAMNNKEIEKKWTNEEQKTSMKWKIN